MCHQPWPWPHSSVRSQQATHTSTKNNTPDTDTHTHTTRTTPQTLKSTPEQLLLSLSCILMRVCETTDTDYPCFRFSCAHNRLRPYHFLGARSCPGRVGGGTHSRSRHLRIRIRLLPSRSRLNISISISQAQDDTTHNIRHDSTTSRVANRAHGLLPGRIFVLLKLVYIYIYIYNIT